jgi:predicted NAD/FAD-binding protein
MEQDVRTDHRSGEPQAIRHIAVIGSGIAGLSAAWLLAHEHRVTLFEVEGRPGGHSNTAMVPTGDTETAVDTGFIVYNERNYPNLTAMFDHLGVATQRSSMSFAASLDNGRLEYAGGGGPKAMFGQRSNTVSLRFWLMLRDIGRFYHEAPKLIGKPEYERLTLGEYLDRHGYTAAFIEDHLLPMGAAIWSTTARQMRDYPLIAFVRFFIHHGLLDLVDRPRWRTVTGGSTSYVRRMLGAIHDVRLGAGAAQIRREHGGVTIIDTHGERSWFTDVVIATHADQALKLLADPDEAETSLLGAFDYTDNEAVLHRDTALMPHRQRVWSSWNYIGESSDTGERPLCVTYWMNRLQSLDPKHPIFVTLNPTRDVAADKLIASYHYTHPLFDRKAVEAQQHLWRLQGNRHTFFAGSYFGAGFHEDALQSGLAAAEAVGGVRRPWRVEGESNRIALAPMLEAAE